MKYQRLIMNFTFDFSVLFITVKRIKCSNAPMSISVLTLYFRSEIVYAVYTMLIIYLILTYNPLEYQSSHNGYTLGILSQNISISVHCLILDK